MSSSQYDPLGLRDERTNWIVKVGGLDISSAVVEGSTTSAMNKMPIAIFSLSLTSPVIPLIDYTGQVTAEMVRGPDSQLAFTGHITSAAPDHDRLQLHCEGGYPGMQDRLVGEQINRVPVEDLVYALARDSGVPRDSIQLHGWQEPPCEVFEVVAPLAGVSVGSPVQVADVRFVGRDVLESAISELSNDGLAHQFLAHSTFAVSYVTESRVFDAERIGLEKIDGALGWLTVATRYSVAADPSGSTRAWNRHSLLFDVRRASLVYARGITTQRAWLRDTTIRTREVNLNVSQVHLTAPNPFFGDNAAPLYQAVRAVRRSCQGSEPIEQVTSLWDAIEFYAGSTEVPTIFSPAKMRFIKRLLKKCFRPRLTEEQYDRLEYVVGGANNPPLIAKLRHQLAIDGVLVTEKEMEVLGRLRKVRNLASHGRVGGALMDQDIVHGIALVSRLLMVAAVNRRKASTPDY